MFPAWARRRDVIGWCLYDLANSVYAAVIPATIWSAYYADSIVGAGGEGARWWGRAVSLTMVLVAVTSPFLGAVADRAGWRKRLLVIYTLASIAGTALLATVAPGMIIYGLLMSVLAGVGFEGAMVFYNSFLPDLVGPDKQGRLSGMGFAVGYAGSFVGLLAALPLVKAGRYSEAFVLVAVLFLLFSLPAFLWLPRDRMAVHSVWRAGAEGWQGTVRTAREIMRTPDLRRFLISFFLYDDAVNTVIAFSSIFAREVLGFAMIDLLLVYLCVQLSALVGASLWAKPADTRGPKFVVMCTLIQWIIVVGLIHFVHTRTQFFIIAALAGTGLGAVQSASRAFMATLIPKGREGEFFGFYSLCGKGAAVLGPLVFGEIAAMTGGNLRLAVLSVLFFFIGGTVILSTVRAGGPTVASVARRHEVGSPS
ncbi:MAG: MFS transporter [candidate division Zixibacteria bacterium]|nr:MFS transporter [candidate division Zixibacteria bacterium]